MLVKCKMFLFVLFIVSYSASYSQQIIVHDPVMIKTDNMYYLFCTGNGITSWSSPDMHNWKHLKPVFEKAPSWTFEKVEGFKGHIWAPDISYQNGTYYLFYSVSAFAKNTSCIGLTTNTTLNPEDPNFKWVDKGLIVQSVPGRDMWNAIDPNLIFDVEGAPWLTFGSFWNGIKLVKLKPDLSGVAEPEVWYTIAGRPRNFELNERDPGDNAIEAPFIFRKNDFYYLFVSFDYCCRGVKSNYKVMVGRSKNINGPYFDKDSVKMTQGGGSSVVAGDDNWPGVGHNATYTFDGKDYIIYHAYDASDEGKPKLQIKELEWDSNGWPYCKPE